MDTQTAWKIFVPYKNIIFDFGGIFVDLDFQRTAEALSRLGGTVDFSLLFSKAKQSDLFDLFETGKIHQDEFLSQLKTVLNLHHVPDHSLIEAWCEMLLEVRPERVEFLRELKKTKKIFLLSNINPLHEEHMLTYFSKNSSLQDFYSLFDRVYFSHQVGLRKPDREIFEFVCKDSALDLEHTLFIDDSIQHIEGAKKFGLAVHHLDPSNSFIVGLQ